MGNRVSTLKWTILVMAGLFVFSHALKRDILYERSYTGDLRNRVVGARIIKDKGSPYFYKWKKGDGFRYYDPGNFDAAHPSITTTSPFFEQLLSPVVDLPQSQIEQFWLIFEYLALAGMVIFIFSWSTTDKQRLAVGWLYLLFLMTNAWKDHVAVGQSYIVIPLFTMLFFACWQRVRNIGWALAAGTAAGCLLLIRVNTLVFFIPFIFLIPRYPRSWIVAFFAPVIILLGWSVLDKRESGLWKDYEQMVQEQIVIQQELHPVLQHNDPDPHFKEWEGINMDAVDAATKEQNDPIYKENGNFFMLVRLIFHRKLSVAFLGLSAIFLIAALTIFFYWLHAPFGRQDVARVALFGYCLYMISDLFSPIYRGEYYAVQWLFPLLIAAGTYQGRMKAAYGILLAGLLLSCIHLPFVKFSNTIGEYLFLVALLAISMRKKVL